MRPDISGPEMTDGRRARGARTREAAVAEALQLASVEGLEGLSIARLAAQLGTAKSTVHATFGSKEDLQLAVIAATSGILMELVVQPSQKAAPGLARLRALGEAWMTYLERETFAGGCVLSSASLEMDGRPGPVRDAVAAVMKEWLSLLERNVHDAIIAGDVAKDCLPAQLAFELNAIGMSANWHFQLFRNAKAFKIGRLGWTNTLDAHCI